MITYTTWLVIIGTALLGITAGTLGVFAVLRRHSLLGDAISHAAFPGIVGIFLFTHSKHPAVLFLGGSIAGGLGALCIAGINRYTRLKKDTALGIVLSVFFGTGLVLMTILQKKSVASQAILNKFLFGNAATLLIQDVYVIVFISIAVLICIGLFKKEFMLLIFDESYAHTLSYPVALLDVFLIFLLVMTLMIGLQTVGVVLMSTMLIAPAVAARQWTNRLNPMIILAATLCSCSCIMGSYISSLFDRMPTGPVIVVLLSMIVLFSLFCAPSSKAPKGL